jgi:hypothetical protein
MATRTLEDQVSALLTRTVAETKQLGVQRPELEASAVFDSIALNLLFKPRGSLYFAFLARNALTSAVRNELTLVDALTKDIDDLGNQAFRISGAPMLRRAQVALMNMEGLPRVSSTSAVLDLYNKTVSEFLEKHLSKNVRRVGQPGMIRPSAEAEQDLPDTLALLKDAHGDVLDRLYALATGIENFDAAPFSAVIGTSTVVRARADLDAIVALVEGGGDPENSRDIVIRLLASRAAINTVATPPKWTDLLLPTGARASTPQAAAVQVGSVSHPFTMPSNSVLAISDGTATSSFGFLPGGAAILVGTQASYPITIPTGFDLFLSYVVGGVTTALRVPMAGTYSNVAGVAAHIMAGAGSSGVQAAQFGNDTTRLMLYKSGADSIAVNPVYVMSVAESQAAGVTTGGRVTYSDSAATYIGLKDTDVGGTVVFADVVADAITSIFGSIVSATFTADGRISITTLSSAHGVSLRVFGSAGQVLGFDDAVHPATAITCVVAGVPDHSALVQDADLLVLPDKTEVPLSEVLATGLGFSTPVPTFSGPVTAKSILATSYSLFISALKTFLASWSSTPYVSDLTVIDRAVAPLVAAQSPAQRKEALDAVASLKTALTSLLNVLSDASTMLPDRAALAEKKMVEGILNTLEERHYSRAIDLLLRCDLQALLEMDDSSASYGGNFMKASTALARATIKMTDPVTSTEPGSYSVGLG